MSKSWWNEGARRGAEGRAEGRADGRAEGRAELLLRQLAFKFGKLPDAVEQRVRSASIAELDGWAVHVLTAQAIGDVFQS